MKGLFRQERDDVRKIVVLTDLSIDGVMQAPGNPDEDTSGKFEHGGWLAPFADEALDEAVDKDLSTPFDMLLGSTTYTSFASYWPTQTGVIADAFNRATKYVVSSKSVDLMWARSVPVTDDVVAEIKALKDGDGPMLQVWGSGTLIQTLLGNDLVDELRLRIYPITLGSGNRLFAEGTIPAAFELTASQVLPSGALLVNYTRSGDLRTGPVG
jgi:dihydrofolate reductase